METCKTVLLVDDEQGILDAYLGFLSGRASPVVRSARLAATEEEPGSALPDWRLLTAGSGEEAVNLVESELEQGRRIACGFFDMKMPGGMDGLETIRQVRERDPNVLVTIATAHQDRSIDELSRLFGADQQDEWDYLAKPFTKWEVIQKCRQMVDSWNRRRREEVLSRTLEARVEERTHQLSEANRCLEERNSRLEEVLEKLRTTQARLVQSEKMATIGQLAAGVAHEINNPVGFVHSNLGSLDRYVTAIREYLEGVESYGSGRQLEELRRQLEIDFILDDLPALVSQSRDGTERIKNIVLNLKTFSHPGHGTKRPEDLNKGLRTTLELVAAEMRRHGELEVDLGELPPVSCNLSELNQVWMNLLVNAVHALEGTEAPGRVQVRSLYDGEQVKVSVEDNGCGMDAEEAAQVFHPFFTTKEVGEGTGLGLSVVFAIVDGLGGRIEVDSEPGRGSRFTVTLPPAHSMATVG